jgi:hypothetical protein
MTAPYYVALYGGFLVAEEYSVPGKGTEIRRFTVPDARQADTWDTFGQADKAAKIAVDQLYPPDLRYFAILNVARD